MIRTMTRAAALAAGLFALPALAAEGISIDDPYARTSRPGAPTGAAFMAITNHGPGDDRLVAADSDIAARVELHTHEEDAEGVMRMIHVEEGFPLPAGETVMLERGGRHVMFMGLNRDLAQGDRVSVTLTFEQAGDMVVEIPVDNAR
jgi:copper(I)-binding protein